MKDNNYGGKAEAKSSDKSKMGVKSSKIDAMGDVKGKDLASYSKAGISNQKKQAGAE
jgi:hypothetical protein